MMVAFRSSFFESAILCFKTGRIKEAEKAAFETFCSNPYWINRFLGWPVIPLDIWHSSNVTTIEYTEALNWSSQQADLADFTEWLVDFISTDNFKHRSEQYLAIYRLLKTEKEGEIRSSLVKEAWRIRGGE